MRNTLGIATDGYLSPNSKRKLLVIAVDGYLHFHIRKGVKDALSRGKNEYIEYENDDNEVIQIINLFFNKVWDL